jgi:N-acyl-D-aspartate/D-glutamate deacylase
MYQVAQDAMAEGIDIRPQIAGRPTGILHGLTSSFHVFSGHPTYRREISHLPLERKIEMMKRPDIRAAIMSEQSRMHAGAMARGPEQLLYYVFPLGENPIYERERHESVGGLAEAAGVPPLDMMYDMLLRDGGVELFYQPLRAFGPYRFDFFLDHMQHPKTLFGLSDGGAHCGVIADAGMPTFILTHWARDRRHGARLPLEFLVRKLSSDTARAFGMTDRGEVRPGLLADLNIIDFDHLRLFRPEAVYDLPAGGKRLVQRVEGYRYTVKSGQVTFEDGRHTGALPGGLVRGGREAVFHRQPIAAE